MNRREIALMTRLENEGISILEADIQPWGLYCREKRLILLRRGMKTCQRLAVLYHEAHHHWRGDDGHQSRAVEEQINRQVAGLLISEPAYRVAEMIHEGSVSGIASEMDVPVWIVEAYRDGLVAL